MDIIILVCLVFIIVLLLRDKIVIRLITKEEKPEAFHRKEFPDIMGRSKPIQRLPMPKEDNQSQTIKLGKDFLPIPDWREEEEEWRKLSEPNGEDGFASGVTFEELNTVSSLLQKEVLLPEQEKQAVNIVQKIQGTELFELLNNSMEDSSRKIAQLLDKSIPADNNSNISNENNRGNFDIEDFL